MRSLWFWLVGFLCTALAPAQARQVSLELENGKVVEGLVIEIDSRAIRVAVDGQELTFQTDQIRKAQFTEVEGAPPVVSQPAASPKATTTAPPAATAAAPEPATSPAAVAPEDKVAAPATPAQDPAPAASQVSKPRRQRGLSPLWDARTEALDRKYPWLFPAEPLQWISLGIMLFALLSLAVHFSSRLAAAENPGFGRACGFGLWLLFSSAVQMALVPGTREAVAGAIGGSVLVTTILYGVVYRLSFGASILATSLLAIEGGIFYALLQLVDATLRSIGNTTF